MGHIPQKGPNGLRKVSVTLGSVHNLSDASGLTEMIQDSWCTNYISVMTRESLGIEGGGGAYFWNENLVY